MSEPFRRGSRKGPRRGTRARRSAGRCRPPGAGSAARGTRRQGRPRSKGRDTSPEESGESTPGGATGGLNQIQKKPGPEPIVICSHAVDGARRAKPARAAAATSSTGGNSAISKEYRALRADASRAPAAQFRSNEPPALRRTSADPSEWVPPVESRCLNRAMSAM